MLVLFAMLMAIVAGCKMKEFSSTPFYSGDEVKFTGKVEDQVNLWPLAYWRAPVCSVLWPLVLFSDDECYIFPFWVHEKHNEFDLKKTLVDQGCIEACSKFEVHDKDRWFLAFDRNDVICSTGPIAGTNEVVHSVEYKPWILCVIYYQRLMRFDAVTHEKTYDNEIRGFSGLSSLIYQYSYSKDIVGNCGTQVQHQALFYIWDWAKKKNGDIALDVFPYFTYDSKTNGYSKTSFLWRFFRYENDPENGKKVDILFIPVWR